MIEDNYSEQQGPPIQVLITNVSGIVFEIVTRALQQDGIAIRSYSAGLDELVVNVGDQTDVLIIGAPYVYPPPTICRGLWDSFPTLKILVLAPCGDAAVMYWLSVRRNRLKTVSAQTLVGSIRHVHRLDLTAGLLGL
jgi:hypothetical protein